MSPEEINKLDWDKQGGLIPAIVQDAANGRVLMLGFMNRDALTATLTSRHVTFWSRTKNRLWTKGETSGHTLDLIGVETDCDSDALLIQAKPNGPTCHLGRASCFPKAPSNFLSDLDAVISERSTSRPTDSYTTKLFESGTKRIAQKVGEEGVETALAGVGDDDAELIGEAADLIYHLAVLLRARGLSLADVTDTLKNRHST
ncbi:MAG: bifunctional phosphoribosyl-AMP cyclohydrolase/phosphoribosyl-ATP diphosphatase HisIE [Vicinamibacteria bacterium]